MFFEKSNQFYKHFWSYFATQKSYCITIVNFNKIMIKTIKDQLKEKSRSYLVFGFRWMVDRDKYYKQKK